MKKSCLAARTVLASLLTVCMVALLAGCAQTHAHRKPAPPPPKSPTASRSLPPKAKPSPTPPGLTRSLPPRTPKAPSPYRTLTKEHPPQGKITVGNTFRVRTTAYTSKKNAIGKRISHGKVTSAASDWSRFPLGTRFRIRETGKVYEIDDYGSALVGSHTIDLAQTGKHGVRRWGVRWVHIDILQWGSPRRSLEVLKPRVAYRHIRPMVRDLNKQTEGIPSRFQRHQP